MLPMCSVTQHREDLLMEPLLHGGKPVQGKWKQHLAIQEYLLLAGPLVFMPLAAEETLQGFLEGE